MKDSLHSQFYEKNTNLQQRIFGFGKAHDIVRSLAPMFVSHSFFLCTLSNQIHPPSIVAIYNISTGLQSIDDNLDIL